MSDPNTEGLSSVPPTDPNTEVPSESPASDPTTETEDPDGTPKENPAG
ncbi:hypothetical protein BH09ACT1_BH09ACT1_09880 [soil metagenome]